MIYYKDRITPHNITSLKENEIFVFGANQKFFNGLGSAKQAMLYGAQFYKGPFVGQTYGICTKDNHIKTLPLNKIKEYVDKFLIFAKENKQYTFLVVPIGTMLAGYKPKDIAPFFIEGKYIDNIHLPEEFWKIILELK